MSNRDIICGSVALFTSECNAEDNDIILDAVGEILETAHPDMNQTHPGIEVQVCLRIVLNNPRFQSPKT